jgi:DNA-binding beta-propeller fold protein YncE
MMGCGGNNVPIGPSCNNPNGIGGFTVHISDVNANGLITGDAASGKAYGNFASGLPNSKLQGCTTSFGSASSFLGTPVSVSYGESPALWSGAFKAWCVDPTIAPNGLSWSTDVYVGDPVNPNGGGPLNEIGSCNTSPAASFFELAGSLPGTLTIPAAGLSTQYGLPRLQVSSIKQNGALSYTQALSVASNGSSATFQFPPNSTGSSLSTGLYGYVLQNQTGPGVYTDVAGDALTIGTATSMAAPYGVDVINQSTSVLTENCVGNQYGPPTCTFSTTNSSAILPLVTLLNSGQLSYSGQTIAVGSQPSAVKAYHIATASQGTPGNAGYVQITQPFYALVANAGSNTVSVVNITPFQTHGVVGTIGVGVQPVAILIDSTGTYAYVANLSSSTVSQINLSSKTVVGTAVAGSSPTSLAMDPSGTAFWVGGLNYVSKINTSNLSTATTYTVNGQVTSLSVSAGQNQYVYTVVSGSSFAGAHAALSSGTPHTDYLLTMPASHLKSEASGGLPSWLNIGGPLVSVSYGNRYIVEGTPAGFAVLDLQTNKVMMQGLTSAPIVGIAVDPQQGTAYATETSTNTLLSIPLPPVQAN